MSYPIYLNIDAFKTWQLVIPAHDKVIDGESAAHKSPVLLNSHDTRSWCFMHLRKGTSLTLFHVCPSRLQLMEQTQKYCFQGASSLSKCSGWIIKHQWQNNLSQCTSIFPYALHEKLVRIFTGQSAQNRDVCWIFCVWPAIYRTFLWDRI